MQNCANVALNALLSDWIIHPLQGLPSLRGNLAWTAHVCHPTSTLKAYKRCERGYLNVLCIRNYYSSRNKRGRRSDLNMGGRERRAGKRGGSEGQKRKKTTAPEAKGSSLRILNRRIILMKKQMTNTSHRTQWFLNQRCSLYKSPNHRGGKAQCGKRGAGG